MTVIYGHYPSIIEIGSLFCCSSLVVVVVVKIIVTMTTHLSPVPFIIETSIVEIGSVVFVVAWLFTTGVNFNFKNKQHLSELNGTKR